MTVMPLETRSALAETLAACGEQIAGTAERVVDAVHMPWQGASLSARERLAIQESAQELRRSSASLYAASLSLLAQLNDAEGRR
jgi:hypothetical protein